MDKDIYLNSLVGFAPNSEYEFNIEDKKLKDIMDRKRSTKNTSGIEKEVLDVMVNLAKQGSRLLCGKNWTVVGQKIEWEMGSESCPNNWWSCSS